MLRLALALCLGISTAAIAQEETKYFHTKQECAPVEVMIDVVRNYGEEPLFTGQSLTFSIEGQSFTGGSMFFVNQDTGTWTMLTMYRDGTACMSAVGTEFKPYVQGQVTNR